MSVIETEEEVIIESPAPVTTGEEGLAEEHMTTIFNAEGPIKIQSGETVIMITPEGIEMEAPDISLTAEAAVEVEAGADFDLTVGGAVEVESSDISIAAAAVEVEAALFTVE